MHDSHNRVFPKYGKVGKTGIIVQLLIETNFCKNLHFNGPLN